MSASESLQHNISLLETVWNREERELISNTLLKSQKQSKKQKTFKQIDRETIDKLNNLVYFS